MLLSGEEEKKEEPGEETRPCARRDAGSGGWAGGRWRRRMPMGGGASQWRPKVHVGQAYGARYSRGAEADGFQQGPV